MFVKQPESWSWNTDQRFSRASCAHECGAPVSLVQRESLLEHVLHDALSARVAARHEAEAGGALAAQLGADEHRRRAAVQLVQAPRPVLSERQNRGHAVGLGVCEKVFYRSIISVREAQCTLAAKTKDQGTKRLKDYRPFSFNHPNITVCNNTAAQSHE